MNICTVCGIVGAASNSIASTLAGRCLMRVGGVHGVGNALRLEDVWGNMTGADMVAMELDGKDVGKYLRTWNIYRSILLRSMHKRTRKKSLLE